MWSYLERSMGGSVIRYDLIDILFMFILSYADIPILTIFEGHFVKCQLCDSWKPPRRMPSPLRTTRAAPRLRLWAVLKRWNHRAILITVAKQSKMWWPARKEFRLHVCPNLLRKRPSNNSFKLSSCIFICLMGWQSPIDPYILRGRSTWSTTKPLGCLSNYDYTVRYCPDQEGIRQIGSNWDPHVGHLLWT